MQVCLFMLWVSFRSGVALAQYCVFQWWVIISLFLCTGLMCCTDQSTCLCTQMPGKFNSTDLLQPRPTLMVLLASTHSSWHTYLKPQTPNPNPIWKPQGFLGQCNQLHHSSSHLRGYRDLHWLVENLPVATGRNQTSVVHLQSVVAERGAWQRNKYEWHTGLEGTNEFVLCWLLRWECYYCATMVPN